MSDFTQALRDVETRVRELDPRIGGEDPRTLFSRVYALPCYDPLLAGTLTGRDSYECAVTNAALCVLLAASIDRAENLNITSGNEAA